MCSCKQLNLMLLISKRKLYLMLVVMEQCQCMNPDESVRRRTEVLSCGWVHKFALESGGRSEDSINLLTLGWTIRWGRECTVQKIVYYCRHGPSV